MNEIEVISRGVYVHKNRLLTCKISRMPSSYYLPGGHVEFGETLAQALQREWQEELACSCKVGKFLQFFEGHFTDAQQGPCHEYSFLFLVDSPELPNDDFQSPTEPKLSFHWIPIHELSSAQLLPLPARDYLVNVLH